MNGFFKASKKEPAGASVFKFSFKLGGDEELEESAPTKKKNKNKKKKKKAPATRTLAEEDLNQDEQAVNSVDPVEEVKLSNVDSEVVELVGLLDDVGLSSDGIQSENPEPNKDKPLSKSQKKNLQKKKAKKSSEQPITLTGKTDDSEKLPTKPQAIQAKAAVSEKPTKASNTTKIESLPDSDDEFAIPEPKAPKNKKPKVQPKKAKSKSSHPEPRATGLAFANLVSPEQRGPHFLSSKDPELDEATKLRFKYGMGRNLVAIGPAKVRDPNWLPPPPGLTRSTPLGRAFDTANAKSSSPVKKTPVKSTIAVETSSQEVHSSPFSFSFNGL